MALGVPAAHLRGSPSGPTGGCGLPAVPPSSPAGIAPLSHTLVCFLEGSGVQSQGDSFTWQEGRTACGMLGVTQPTSASSPLPGQRTALPSLGLATRAVVSSRDKVLVSSSDRPERGALLCALEPDTGTAASRPELSREDAPSGCRGMVTGQQAGLPAHGHSSCGIHSFIHSFTHP